jgi:hypothetical protein
MRRTRNGRARLQSQDPLAELVPTYLDGQLSPEGVALLEERLKRDTWQRARSAAGWLSDLWPFDQAKLPRSLVGCEAV